MSGEADGRRAREAFERAVEALSHRERTTPELSAWLGERGFTAHEVDAAIARLVEIGELDDARFARQFAADKRELRGWGADRIREALLARGVERECLAVALADGEAEELERAVGLLEGRGESLTDEAARGRALAYLARRGYDADTAYEAVRRCERRAA